MRLRSDLRERTLGQSTLLEPAPGQRCNFVVAKLASVASLAALGAVVVTGFAVGVSTSSTTAPKLTPKPTTFSVTRVQASEIAEVAGFLRAYNSRHLKAALRYFYFPKKLRQFQVDGATDCDYRRRTTNVYAHRTGVVRWLKQRFADHDRLTLARILDKNPAQPIGVVGIEYARRESDTLRKLGFPRGIVPQMGQKLPFSFGSGAKFDFFALASPRTPTPNPECALVAYRR